MVSTQFADLAPRFRTGGARNMSKLSDAQLDMLIDAQQVEVRDQEKRKQLYMQIQRRIIELAALIPLQGSVSGEAVWPFVKNYALNRSSEYDNHSSTGLEL